MELRKIPPVGWIAGGVVVVVLLGLAGSAYVSMRRRADLELCALHLRTIHNAIRSGELPDSPKWRELGTGREFLANYPRWPTRLHRPLELDCPVKGHPGEIDYRGPARPLGQMRRDEPLLADRPGNHGPGRGGNVCLATGAIHECAEQDDLWAQAARSTSD